MKYLVRFPARVCSKIATCSDKFTTNITKSQTKGEGIVSNLSDYVEKWLSGEESENPSSKSSKNY